MLPVGSAGAYLSAGDTLFPAPRCRRTGCARGQLSVSRLGLLEIKGKYNRHSNRHQSPPNRHAKRYQNDLWDNSKALLKKDHVKSCSGHDFICIRSWYCHLQVRIHAWVTIRARGGAHAHSHTLHLFASERQMESSPNFERT